MTIKTIGRFGNGVCFSLDDPAGGASPDAGTEDTAAAEASQQGAEQAEGAKPSEGEADAGDWRTSIADENLREHAGRFTSVEALAKAHKDLRERLSKAVNAPGEDATDEEVAAYREKMGIPESPEGYTAPEIEGYEQTDADKQYQGEMASILHAEGIPKAAFDKLAEAHIGFIQKQQAAAAEAQTKADTEYLTQAEANLRKEWGQDYPANMKYSEEAARSFFDQDVGAFELKNGQLLGSHPDFIKGMAQIGRNLGEGVIHVQPGSDAAQSLNEQADRAASKRREAQAAGNNAEALKWDREERKILAKVHGS